MSLWALHGPLQKYKKNDLTVHIFYVFHKNNYGTLSELEKGKTRLFYKLQMIDAALTLIGRLFDEIDV